MHRFAVNEEVARLEQALLPLRGAARVPVLVPLAWHLRQRDTQRALSLADAVCALLAGAEPADLPYSAVERAGASARMALVRAEAQWLGGELHQALEAAQAVLQRFTELLDAPGCADTHWLLAWIAVDLGQHGAADAAFAAAAKAARGAGDELRVLLAQAASARWAVLRDRNLAVERWGGKFDGDIGRLHPSLETWSCDFLALAATFSADYGQAAGYFMRSYEAALATGQLRSAITAAANIRENFTLLNDHDAALEWAQRALDLGRPLGWPRSVGGALMHTADTLRRVGQLDAAHAMLHEALAILKPLKGARSYATALQYLGELSLDSGDFGAALDAFTRLEARADALDQSDFRSVARRGRAHALSHLNRPHEALLAADSAVALAAAQAQAHYHLAALRVMAVIHTRHALPAPPDMAAPNPALHYLLQALALAATIDGYSVPADLYDDVAREYAGAGDHARAYQLALSASAAREKTHSKETTSRAVAMQVHHQTAQARSEGAHHRALAESEARRAEVLQRTGATLERLSAIGQEITAHLDAPSVFGALDRHIHGLLAAATFAIYLTDAAGARLERAFGVELGQPLPPRSIPLSDPHAWPVRCLAGRSEIYLDDRSADPRRHVTPGTLDNLSALFGPLLVGERVIGVMTVQAPQPHAYGEHERMVFRTLCAYGAIALDNAQAYRQLKDAQTQLVSQEKLAALGALVAGVAHELNTPIGNSLLIASTMEEKAAQVEALVNGRGLRRSELAAFIDDSRKASVLVMRGLASAADLVNSFKQVAVDRTTEQRRAFNLQQVCREVVATMMNRVRGAGHNFELRVAPTIEMDSYPGPLGQVVTNLINNALLHAFQGGGGGSMVLAASAHAGRVTLEFSDDGCGIPDLHVGRIFDPFFTTRLGQGGSGLGLSISHNIVTALLGGQIAVASHAARGTCFTLDLPLTAPRHPSASAAG